MWTCFFLLCTERKPGRFLLLKGYLGWSFGLFFIVFCGGFYYVERGDFLINPDFKKGRKGHLCKQMCTLQLRYVLGHLLIGHCYFLHLFYSLDLLLLYLLSLSYWCTCSCYIFRLVWFWSEVFPLHFPVCLAVSLCKLMESADKGILKCSAARGRMEFVQSFKRQ